MVSSEQLNLKDSIFHFWNMIRVDLLKLFKNKITYAWLIAGIFLQVMRVLNASLFNPTSTVITQGLSDFIYIWSMFIIGLAASAVTSETGEFADSIMSKSVKRYEYILAKFSSRISHVMMIYSVIAMVLIGASIKMSSNDFNVYGLIGVFLIVALVLIMLTTLGVALSTVLTNSVMSIVILLVLWYSMTFFFPMLDLELLSPSSLINQLPDFIQGIWNEEVWKTIAGYFSISVVSIVLSTFYFSIKDL